MEVLHTAIWVSDLAATREFYCDGIGLAHSRDFETDGVRNYFVRGESDAEIQFKYDPEQEGGVAPAGVDHLAVSVDDVRDAVDRLTEEWNSEVITEPTELAQTGSTIAFVTDPDGYAVELIERP